MTLREGELILNGKYYIQRLHAEGGMARVWLAEERTFGDRQVALKEPRPALLSDLAREIEERFRREVRICAALEQVSVPNIVPAITAERYESNPNVRYVEPNYRAYAAATPNDPRFSQLWGME